MTMKELQESGELEGYQAAVPADEDAAMLAEEPCPECGIRPLVCHAYRQPGTSSNYSYRVFSVCPTCDWVAEF